MSLVLIATVSAEMIPIDYIQVSGWVPVVECVASQNPCNRTIVCVENTSVSLGSYSASEVTHHSPSISKTRHSGLTGDLGSTPSWAIILFVFISFELYSPL